MSEQGKKKAVAPVLQNMQDYISNHYMDELLDEVCAGIELGIVENLEIDVGEWKSVLIGTISKIVRTDLVEDRTHLLVDIRSDQIDYLKTAVFPDTMSATSTFLLNSRLMAASRCIRVSRSSVPAVFLSANFHGCRNTLCQF